MLTVRSLGVVLHPTSLPDGRLGPAAYAFVDWLAAAGVTWWQVLPLNPPDEFGSPYASTSAFACWDGLLAEPEARVSTHELVEFLTRSPVFAMCIEGPADNTFSLVRKVVGATKVDDAEPGTIRGDFASITTENLVHASDSHESAIRELKLWFPGL